MKKGLIFCLFICCACGASLRPANLHDFEIQRVSEYPGVEKGELFERAKVWIAEEFVSADHVIEYENKKEGTIVGKGTLKHYSAPMGGPKVFVGYIKYTFIINTKPEKARIIVKDVHLVTKSGGRGTIYEKDWLNSKNEIEAICNRFIAALQDGATQDDW